MTTTFEVYSNNHQLTNRFFLTEEEALKWINFYGLTRQPYEIRKVYRHMTKNPDRERVAERFAKHYEKYGIIDSEQWKKEYFEKKAERKRIAAYRKAEREKIKAKALKK